MFDRTDGAAGELPADDIRSALSAAIASNDGEAADAGPNAELQPDADDGTDKDDTGSVADAEVEGHIPVPESAPDRTNAEQERDETGAPPMSAHNPPSNWKAADRDMFAALPEPAQKFLLERHKAMEADHTRKTQAIADLKREYEPIDAIFTPYRDVMKERGLTARGLIEGWAAVEQRLAEGDGINVIKGLVAGYKLDPADIARALGIETPSAASQPPASSASAPAVPPQLPPELLQDIARLRQRADADDRARAEAARVAQAATLHKFTTEMEAFKSAQDDEGNLLHPHVDEVQEDMAQLGLAAMSRGHAVPPLQELYERAVRANPSTYQAQRIADQQSAERKRQFEARAKAAAARKASSSVTGAPGSGQPPIGRASGRSLREELEAATDEAA